MINEIITNQGKSRFLKSAVPSDITFESFRASLVGGELPVDLVYPTADTAGISQEGTPLNKETLLNTAAEASIWGDSAPPTPTPSLAFQNLGGRMKSTESSITSALSSISSLNGRLGTLTSNVQRIDSSLTVAENNIAAASASIASIGTQLGAKFDKTGGTINGSVILTHPSDNTKSVVLHCEYPGELAINNVASPSGAGTGDVAVNHLNATTASFHGYINHTTGTADLQNIRCSSLKIMSNFLDMNNKPLQNVPTPQHDTDAVNRGYVDTHASNPRVFKIYYDQLTGQLTTDQEVRQYANCRANAFDIVQTGAGGSIYYYPRPVFFTLLATATDGKLYSVTTNNFEMRPDDDDNIWITFKSYGGTADKTMAFRLNTNNQWTYYNSIIPT